MIVGEPVRDLRSCQSVFEIEIDESQIRGVHLSQRQSSRCMIGHADHDQSQFEQLKFQVQREEYFVFDDEHPRRWLIRSNH